jgi:gamma-glutamyltranspeptidase/glutathione hydrolase
MFKNINNYIDSQKTSIKTSQIARKNQVIISFLVSLTLIIGSASAQTTSFYNPRDIFHPVIARNGMVASQERYATEAGLAVLKEGGNAVDAAVTVGFTLAVTLPEAGNIGGGGFMLVHMAKDNQTLAIDYREKAPKAATRNMFLNANGEVDPKSLDLVI